MKYSIGEFARLLGVSADTIRYYEKLGLCSSSRDPENNYRRYGESDALDFMNLKMCRSLDMGIDEMRDTGQGKSVGEQLSWLERKQAETAAEIERLQRQSARIEELKKFYAFACGEEDRVGEVDMCAAYSLYTFGSLSHRGPEALRLARVWMDSLPFTFVTVGITRESLLSRGEALDLRLGLGVLDRYQASLHLPLTPDVEPFPAGHGVYQHLGVRDFFSIGKSDIAPLYEYIERKGLRITSGATGRTLASEYRDGQILHHISFRVLVEEK
jgi:DNA-binding transcriptional MerR regulator